MMGTVQYDGKIAVVTGASGGIGGAVAEALHERGAHVVLAARSVDKLNDFAGKLGSRATAIALDVADERSVARAFEEIEARFGRVDLLVNNAGFGRFELVADAPADSFESMMNVNYFGTVRCTRAALPGMLSRREGWIVNVASIAGKTATAKSAGYAATKHAVLGFTNALRQELHGTGIRVVAVNPGPVRTAFFDLADPEGGYVNGVKSMMVTPERVARETLAGLDRGRAEVNVPGWLGAAARLSQALPIGLVNAFSARFLKLK
ncbi:SDR family oxidoreductase [Paenibacillus sp.]|uniref:SDR family NAD(P)-dependent oxidoreductase n=1 Tax=Paenibacillus sp. TaxID=58172 RepID=UPI0028111A50|nr:SDR family oxidoreductase [Paenibacillus sp.]